MGHFSFSVQIFTSSLLRKINVQVSHKLTPTHTTPVSLPLTNSSEVPQKQPFLQMVLIDI